MIAVATVIFTAARRRVREEILLAQTRLAYEQELRHIEAETIEATLSQVSAELHDNIGQLLTVARLQIEKAQLVSPPVVTEKLAPISGSLGAAIQQVRLLSHSLNTDFIGDGGLLKAIATEVKRLQSIGSHTITFTHDGQEPPLSKDQRTVVFRIVQEILSNALRHAGAETLLISLQAAGKAFLCISDDGKGFDKAATLDANHGLGLRNMLKRAALADLSLDIQTAPGSGSRFELRVRSNNAQDTSEQTNSLRTASGF